jgi:hypothetical protein
VFATTLMLLASIAPAAATGGMVPMAIKPGTAA